MATQQDWMKMTDDIMAEVLTEVLALGVCLQEEDCSHFCKNYDGDCGNHEDWMT